MRTVVGLYDRFEEAQKVVRALVDEGISREDISLIARDAEGEYARYMGDDAEGGKENVADGAAAGAGIGAVLGGLGGLVVGLGALAIPGIGPVIAAGPLAATLAGAGIGAAAGGVIGALTDLGVPDEHAQAYAEGVRRGGTLVVARVGDEHANHAVDVMNRFNPIDINERSSYWRQNEWNGFREDAEPMNTSDMDMERSHYRQEVPVTGNQTDDMTIPVVEEELRIGKREVERGGERINTYTNEQEVTEDINLRSEHVHVERRPVDRPATDADFQAFQEGSMELKETSEEAVVDKHARVVEEVHVNKDVEERKETIRDTVRRTEVDVENIGHGRTTEDWNRYDSMYRQDYQTRFASRGRGYDYYQPAYRYGYELRSNPRYQSYTDWSQVEREARSDWDRSGNQSTWDDIKDAVRHGWESVRR
jgi:uncharacterized protein (TIGR02271 family)